MESSHCCEAAVAVLGLVPPTTRLTFPFASFGAAHLRSRRKRWGDRRQAALGAVLPSPLRRGAADTTNLNKNLLTSSIRQTLVLIPAAVGSRLYFYHSPQSSFFLLFSILPPLRSRTVEAVGACLPHLFLRQARPARMEAGGLRLL